MQISKIIDPSPIASKFNRKQLYYIAKHNGIDCTPGEGADFLRNVIEGKGIDLNQYNPQSIGPLHGQLNHKFDHSRMKELVGEKEPKKTTEQILMERVEALEAELKESKVETIIEDVSIFDMKFNELKKFLKDRSIEYDRTDKIPDLQAKAKAYLDGN